MNPRCRGAVLLVLLLTVMATPDQARAEGSNSGKGSSNSGSSNSGSSSPGSSGSGSSGSGSSGSLKTTGSTRKNDDDDVATPSTAVNSTPSLTVTSAPTATSPNANTSSEIPTPSQPPASSVAASTISPPSSAPRNTNGDRRYERATSCGSLTLRIDVRSEGSNLRVRSTIDRSRAQWSAVVVQDRRVVWRGPARRGQIDRRFAELPGPQTLSVRLTNTAGAVCAAEIRLSD